MMWYIPNRGQLLTLEVATWISFSSGLYSGTDESRRGNGLVGRVADKLRRDDTVSPAFVSLVYYAHKAGFGESDVTAGSIGPGTLGRVKLGSCWCNRALYWRA
jgi:hypothetical protein